MAYVAARAVTDSRYTGEEVAEQEIAICDDFEHKRRLIRLAAQLRRARASMLAFANIVQDPT